MFHEEWRLHARLFGGKRFAAFPLVVAAAGAGAVWTLVVTGTAPETIILGLHLLVVAFGVHTGSVGLIGTDAMRNVLGDVTFLAFSARTLPISQRRLLGLFVVKDLGFYSVLFLLPLTVAAVPAIVATPTTVDPTGAISIWSLITSIGLLWVGLTGSFLLGVGLTIGGIGLSSRGRVWILSSATIVVAGGVLVLSGTVDPLAFTPYGFYRTPTVATALTGYGPAVAFAIVAALAYDPGAADQSAPRRRRPESTRGRVSRWLLRTDPLLAKSVLDVSRSSGGLWKVAFSGGVLFAVCYGLVALAQTITDVSASPGVSFGAVLSLVAVTSYAWLTQYDDVDEYGSLPVTIEDVFATKFRAFLAVAVPTGVGFYAIAMALTGPTVTDALVGVVVLVGLEVYLFGLAVGTTGLRPDELLFDAGSYVRFGAGMAVALIPVLVVGFVVPLTPVLVAALIVAAIGFGAAGFVLYRWSAPRWAIRYRNGE